MKTVGLILKEGRLKKGVSLEEASELLKIRKEFLQALEENNFSALPAYVSSLGFLRNYAEFLGISPDLVLAIYRRDFSKPSIVVAPKAKHFSIKWGPRLTLVLITVFSFLGLAGYLGYQYFSLRSAPSIEIFSPSEGEKVFQDKIRVRGKVSPDATLTINDISVFLTSEGEFNYELDVFPGENRIVLTAKSRLGKEKRIERTFFRLDK